MRNVLLRILAASGGLALLLGGLWACPLAHDPYETDRACWDRSDCVTSELCAKPDGGELKQGRCKTPSSGLCGAQDGGTDAGLYHCFADDQGTPRECSYVERDKCTQYQRDAGPCPDAGCPDEWCLQWADKWGCR